MTPDKRAQLPSVDRVLNDLAALSGLEVYSHPERVAAIRSVLEDLRSSLSEVDPPSIRTISAMACERLHAQSRSGLTRVVNGTGIVLHTGLGRAPLPDAAATAISAITGYCSLEMDLDSGERGRREGVIEELLRTLTGAEAAAVVNNNAGATLLVLAALCQDKEVVVSRGQLVEIGGSFRLPDVISQSGARMVEIGTTNKTHLRDYENAITSETRVVMHVNQSNYRIIGFTKQVPIEDLVSLKERHEVIVVDDLGCGALIDLSRLGLPKEPMVQESLAAGADVALFSGDKLIGGPQAGIIVGRKIYLERIRKHPLMRALRVGKLTIAALEETLKLFLNNETVCQTNPTLALLGKPVSEVRARAIHLAARLSHILPCEVVEGESASGGGALPGVAIPTALLSLHAGSLAAAELASRLRLGRPPVIPLVRKDQVLLDVRTLRDDDDPLLETAFTHLAATLELSPL